MRTIREWVEVQTSLGKTYPADIVILAIGVRPDTALSQTAGLTIGERGGIRVDEHMRTSDPDIFAVEGKDYEKIYLQNGFKPRNISGGTISRAMYSLASLKY